MNQMRAVGVLALLLATGAGASERHFTYTYDSSVLNPGDRELEPWTTIRAGREGAFARFDERLEFEVGVAERLQTAWYLNFSGVSVPGQASSFSFEGVSWEWKYKLLDPVADAVGLALYFEVMGGLDEAEVEGKLIVDKKIGNVLLAANLVGEHEWEFGAAGIAREVILEFDAAAAWVMPGGLSLGVELRNHNEITPTDGWEHSAFFLGPVLGYTGKGWWATATLLAQVAAPIGASSGGLQLHEHERFEGRMLFGWHL